MHKKDNRFRDTVNFRDLGGYVMEDGRAIKQGLLYRSGGLYKMNEEELAVLRGLSIASIMDLRTKGEAEVHPDPEVPGAVMLQHSGLEIGTANEIDFSPEGMRQIGASGERQIALLRAYYSEIPFYNEAYAELFRKIADFEVPLIFHCASGKDRTGVAAMLVLLLLGASRELAFQDYLLSNEYLREDLEKEYAENQNEMKTHPELKELLTMLAGVSEVAGTLVLDEVYAQYPRIEDYFQAEYGFDEKTIAAIRDFYLE
ncbi:MAG: tyrosine-protein phosphatase [Lachnospiraceae bacterium]|nr:tyrosine-protein phosphatase [Lachnospiraceae bacterium]